MHEKSQCPKALLVALRIALLVAVVLLARPCVGSLEEAYAQELKAERNSTLVVTIKKHAEGGDPDAQYLLGVLYATGEGLPKDHQRAKRWLRLAAEQGDPRAQNCLGLLFDPTWFGNKVASDIDEAAEWYRRAATQGEPSAAYNLQIMKSHKFIVDAQTPNLLLSRAALSGSGNKEGGDAPKNSKEIFKVVAPAIVEVISQGNYGSGVIIGSYRQTGDGAELKAVGHTFKPNFQFTSQALLMPRTLLGEYLVVATNQHVLEGGGKVWLGLGSTADGETVGKAPLSATCLPEDPDLDLALVFVALDGRVAALEKFIHTLPMSESAHKLERGATVYALGNPEKLVRSIAQGLFNGTRPEGLQFDASISHGSSGGALVDEKGQLLGVTTGFSSNKESQNLNFAIPVKAILGMLESRKTKCSTP